MSSSKMLSVIFRKSTFAAQKALHWAGPPQRCWSSALTRASDCGSVSSAKFPSTEKDSGQIKPLAVFGFRKTELFQRIQTHNASFLVQNQHFHSSAVKLKKRPQIEPPPKELDLLRFDMKHLWKGPKPALYLGFAGLIPFVSPTLLMAMTEHCYPELAYAQLAYAASILSFLGGARWGFALPESSPARPDWTNLTNSVVPSLLAWLTMLMSDNFVSAATMVIMALGVSLHCDLTLLPTYPSWFKALRAIFTIMAFCSLLGTLVVWTVYPEKRIFSD